MKPGSRLVLALDEVSLERAIELTKIVERVDAIKVNYPLVLREGLRSVTELAGFAPVICDFKVADIDNTNRLIAEAAFDAGATALIAHSFIGEDSLEACVEVARERNGSVIAVVEMTHPGAKEFIQPRTDDLIALAQRVGVDGYIAPGTRPERIAHIRNVVGEVPLILAPGIGAQGGSARAAIEAGADFIIVGRAIYRAEDPAGAARKILSEIEG